MLRADESIALDAIEVYAMGGDGTAVTANKYHHSDPSTSVNSISLWKRQALHQSVERSGTDGRCGRTCISFARRGTRVACI